MWRKRKRISRVLSIILSLALLSSILVGAIPGSAAVSAATVSLSTFDAAGNPAYVISKLNSYTVTFDVSVAVPVTTGWLDIQFPIDTQLPATGAWVLGDVTVQNTAGFGIANPETEISVPDLTTTAGTATTRPSVRVALTALMHDIGEAAMVRVKFNNDVIRNSPTIGDHTLLINTSSVGDTTPVTSQVFTLNPDEALDVQVIINAPDMVSEDYDFTVTVDIVDVTDLNAAQYDITFDPAVLRLDDVTDGQIDSTDFTVSGYTEIDPGIYRIVNSLGLDSVTGSGHMAVLHFHSIGSLGDSTTIEISDGILSGMAAEIPASWFGDFVEISIQPGDANGDGFINVLDMTKVARIILLMDSETPGADANQDGVVNVLDMTFIARIILGGPQYGGTYTVASAVNWVYFDEVAGGNYGGHVYAPATHLTNNELLQGDWTKGPAGTNETDWIHGGDNRMDQKAGELAESWEIPELGTVIFHIRDDVYWHDKPPANGRQMTPDDVVYSINRAMTGGYFKYAYPTMAATLQATADNIAWTVTCTVPADQWVNLITMIPDYMSIVCPEAIALWGDQSAWEHSLGTGPFILTNWVSNSQAICTRNPYYWETDPIGPGIGNQLPYLDGVKIYIIPDPATRQAAFRVGVIDSLGGLYYNDATALINDPSLSAIEWKEYLPDGALSMFFRTDLPDSPFYHKEVRQAMMLAIDQPLIRDVYYSGHAELVGWPITPTPAYMDAWMGTAGLPPNVAALYGHDLAAAQALLATTPYANGFSCSVICWADPVMIDILSICQAMLADININMEIDIHDYAVYNSRARARNHTANEILYATDSSNGTYLKMIDFRGQGAYNGSYIDWDYSVPEIETAYAAIQPFAGINEPAMMNIHRNLMPWLLEQAYVINSPVPSMYNLWWPWVKNHYGTTNIGYYSNYSQLKYLWIDYDLKDAMGY